jgi:hypothetical protein
VEFTNVRKKTVKKKIYVMLMHVAQEWKSRVPFSCRGLSSHFRLVCLFFFYFLVLFSLISTHSLASDLQRVIGHAMCLESRELKHVQDFLRNEPIIQMLTNGNLDHIPLYRWRHLRDYSLRIDDGRFGYPCLCLAMDADAEDFVSGAGDDNSANVREETRQKVMEYWIQSKRIIAAGALHLPTQFKDDPSSIAVGDLMLFNAKDRNDAVAFAEGLPSAEQGLYQDMRVYFYNNLDITGKFVSEDPLRDSPCEQLKEAMEVWGYPVSDEQTPHLNW